MQRQERLLKAEAMLKILFVTVIKEISSLSLKLTRTCQFVIKKSLKLKPDDVRRSSRRKINAGVRVRNLDASRRDLSFVGRGEGDDKLQKHHT